MATQYMKGEIIAERSRHRQPLGILIARLATLFTMVCLIATLVMLMG